MRPPVTPDHRREPVSGVMIVAVPQAGVAVMEEFEAELLGDGHFRIGGLGPTLPVGEWGEPKCGRQF